MRTSPVAYPPACSSPAKLDADREPERDARIMIRIGQGSFGSGILFIFFFSAFLPAPLNNHKPIAISFRSPDGDAAVGGFRKRRRG